MAVPAWMTDHKLVMYLFSDKHAIPQMASSWVQCWALTLSAYVYSIIYKASKNHLNADSLSRLPLHVSPVEVPAPGETVLLLDCLQVDPLNDRQLKRWTSQDPALSQVRQFILQVWPSTTKATTNHSLISSPALSFYRMRAGS